MTNNPDVEKLLTWLRTTLADYVLEPIALYRAGLRQTYPLIAVSESDLRAKLESGGHFIALPKEPAALANIIEVAVVDFLVQRIEDFPNATIKRGTERGYPDIEINGSYFGGGFHAVDIKVARRSKSGQQTDSRITLYTGNTYFRYPQLHWSSTLRPFQEYASHLDVIALYTLNEQQGSRIEDLRLVAHEPWQIASKQRSSTTREYIGAVMSIADLEAGRGEFDSEAEFYAYWRKYPFKIGRAVQQQLDKLLQARQS